MFWISMMSSACVCLYMSVLYIEQMCLPGPSLLQRSGSWNAPGLPLSELRGVGTSREKKYSSDSKGYVTKKRRCKKIVQTNSAFADVPIPTGKKWGWFIIGFTMVYLIIQQPWNLKVSIHFQHIHQSDWSTSRPPAASPSSFRSAPSGSPPAVKVRMYLNRVERKTMGPPIQAWFEGLFLETHGFLLSTI